MRSDESGGAGGDMGGGGDGGEDEGDGHCAPVKIEKEPDFDRRRSQNVLPGIANH